MLHFCVLLDAAVCCQAFLFFRYNRKRRRNLKSEIWYSEIRKQKSKIRHQKSEIRNPKSVRNRMSKSKIRNQESEIRNQNKILGIRNQKLEIKNRKSRETEILPVKWRHYNTTLISILELAICLQPSLWKGVGGRGWLLQTDGAISSQLLLLFTVYLPRQFKAPSFLPCLCICANCCIHEYFLPHSMLKIEVSFKCES